MTLEEILSKVEDETIKNAIVDVVNSEKEKGIQSYRKKDTEVLKYKNALKTMGYDHEKYSDVDEFINTKKLVEEKATKSEMTIQSLNEKLIEIEANLQAERDKVVRKEQEAKTNYLTSELTKTIGDKFYGSQYMIKTLITDGVVDVQNNKVVFKDGDNILGFDEGVKKLEETNKDILKVNQKTGSGDNGGNPIIPTNTDTVENAIRKEMGLPLKNT